MNENDAKYKTLEQVLKENPQHKKLILAVLNQLGEDLDALDEIYSVIGHDGNDGWSGFIYYRDTIQFTKRNRRYIIRLLEEQADSSGETVQEMVNNFGCFIRYRKKENQGMDADERDSFYRFIGGGRYRDNKDVQFWNLMSRYALEEVARMFEDWD